jgi:hypothetical protein
MAITTTMTAINVIATAKSANERHQPRCIACEEYAGAAATTIAPEDGLGAYGGTTPHEPLRTSGDRRT